MDDEHTALDTECPTMSVPEAGRKYLGLGRDASYAAARRGELPVLYFGKLMRVPRAAMERMLMEAGQPAPSTTTNKSSARH
jgi:excisionase family DNA binding protein